MALNLKKVENQRNRADEQIEQMLLAENLTSTTVTSLETLTEPVSEPTVENVIEPVPPTAPTEQEDSEPTPADLDFKGRADTGRGLNQDGTYRQSNAGRKSKEKAKKKVQMVLTLTPETYNRLIQHAEGKLRSAPVYVSEYIENHLDEILNSF